MVKVMAERCASVATLDELCMLIIMQPVMSRNHRGESSVPPPMKFTRPKGGAGPRRPFFRSVSKSESQDGVGMPSRGGLQSRRSSMKKSPGDSSDDNLELPTTPLPPRFQSVRANRSSNNRVRIMSPQGLSGSSSESDDSTIPTSPTHNKPITLEAKVDVIFGQVQKLSGIFNTMKDNPNPFTPRKKRGLASRFTKTPERTRDGERTKYLVRARAKNRCYDIKKNIL